MSFGLAVSNPTEYLARKRPKSLFLPVGIIHGLNMQSIITYVIRENLHNKMNTQINIDISHSNLSFLLAFWVLTYTPSELHLKKSTT